MATVADAMQAFSELRGKFRFKGEEGELWYRGHASPKWQLEPGLFRKVDAEGPERVQRKGEARGAYDETGMLHNFKVLAPSNHRDHRTIFDWLCLMQHHKAPTRLLDWTENFLCALYFAVQPEDGDTGRMFLLAPQRLNMVVTGSATVFVSDGFHVAMRAALARARDYSGWCRELKTLECFPSSIDAEVGLRFAEKKDPRARRAVHLWLKTPIAVRPNRFNARILAQAGTFTIHGGKLNGHRPRAKAGADLPSALDLGEVDELLSKKPLLGSFDVWKQPVREQLHQMGIHKGTLFPDLDGQVDFLKERWRLRPAESD